LAEGGDQEAEGRFVLERPSLLVDEGKEEPPDLSLLVVYSLVSSLLKLPHIGNFTNLARAYPLLFSKRSLFLRKRGTKRSQFHNVGLFAA
jgi:hypothetical protein